MSVLQRNTLTAERDALKKINVGEFIGNLVFVRREKLSTAIYEESFLCLGTNCMDDFFCFCFVFKSILKHLCCIQKTKKVKNVFLDLESSKRNLTEERDELQMKLTKFAQAQWVYFGGSFYYISATQRSWQSSQYFCQYQGADLVIINSREEEVCIKFQKRAWIGLTDRIQEGSWKWVDGTALTQSYWRFGEPNHFKGRNEDCVEIQNFDSERNWNDAQCANDNYWICEKNFDI
uniref:C-type lectin domain-containing protein n=1 Tax=Xiphophorus maculatus TaxID=8083 RepID=A0A3B5REW9_XIPMA